MKQSFSSRRAAATLALVLVGAGTAFCLFPPSDAYFFAWWETHASEWMLLLLAAGLVFFIFDREQLMYICFLGCAVICYVLQERTADHTQTAWQSEPPVSPRLVLFPLDPDINSRQIHCQPSIHSAVLFYDATANPHLLQKNCSVLLAGGCPHASGHHRAASDPLKSLNLEAIPGADAARIRAADTSHFATKARSPNVTQTSSEFQVRF